MTLHIKRIYEPYSKSDGYRILVDRLWPRGINKDKGHIDEWMKEVAPSTELRKWFNHDNDKREEFRAKYADELKDSQAFDELLKRVSEHKTLTLLFAAREAENNHAAVLKQFIEKHTK